MWLKFNLLETSFKKIICERKALDLLALGKECHFVRLLFYLPSLKKRKTVYTTTPHVQKSWCILTE